MFWKKLEYIMLRTHGRNQIPYLSEICSIQPYCLDNDDTITSPYDIADAFDDYFGSIAETTKKHKIS